jgi:hypothetical protein
MQVISRSNVLSDDLSRGEIYGKDGINSSLVGMLFVLCIGGFKRGRQQVGYSRTNHGNCPAPREAKDRIGTLMVESEDKTAKIDKANLIITDKTRIFKEQDDKRVEATFEEFKTGQLVEAEFGSLIFLFAGV